MKTIVIQANDANQRLDKFLTKSFPNLPQSMLYKSIRKRTSSVTASGVKSPPVCRRGTC